jgi:hypothetical protein
MNWLIGSSQILIGFSVLAAWYIALRFLSSKLRMTNLAFSVVPAVFVVWMVLGVVMIINGIGRV